MANDTLEYKYTYEEFPASQDKAYGMKTLDIDRDEIGVYYDNDIKYITHSGIDLTIQMLTPGYADQRDGKYPCIAFVQGSAWKKQNVYMNLPQMVSFAKRGYVVASIEYRPSEVMPLPAQVKDIKTAIRFLRKNAKAYKIDSENIFLWGDSSGGHCALLAGMTDDIEDFNTKDYGKYSASVNAIVDLYGPTDFVSMGKSISAIDHSPASSAEAVALGGFVPSENIEISDKFAPMNYIDKDRELPPIFIAHGNKDRTVPFDQSTLFAQKLKEYNKEYDFYKIKNADHGGPQFWALELLDLIDEFLKKHIK